MTTTAATGAAVPAPDDDRILPRLPVPGRYVTLVALGFLALMVTGSSSEWIPFGDSFQAGLPDTLASLAFLTWAAAPALTLWRLRAGVVAVVVPALLPLLDGEGRWPIVLLASLLVCAATATWRSRPTAWALAALAMLPVLTYVVGGTTIVVGWGNEVDRGAATAGNLALQALLYAVTAATAVGFGLWMRASYLASQEAKALALRAGDVERESVVVGERARLARDLHDVVAHHVSLIAVRAETAPYTVADLSPAARAVLAEIADDSRRALDELRGVLGILGRSAEAAELAPQPGASDIATLVAAARRGGDDVAWVESDLSGVGAGPGYVAYRVVQEALTNARRHAPGVPVRVEVVAVGVGVLVRVDNATADADVVGGHGLAGMRERVESLGGTLTVTVRDGLLRVEASVPGAAE